MKSGTKFERGEIVLMPFPFTDMSKSKLRPVLIISNVSHNERSLHFVGCGITSNLNNKNDSVLIDETDMIEGTLAKKSRIKLSNIFTPKKLGSKENRPTEFKTRCCN